MPDNEEPVTSPVPSSDPTGQVFVEADDAAPAESGSEPISRPSALRTATVVSARIVLGAVTLGIIGVLVAATIVVPLPTYGSRPVSRVVTPVATAQQLVCPGGLLRLGSTSGANATSASAIGTPLVTSAASPGAVYSSDFADSDAGTGETAAAPRLLSAALSSAAPGRVSGAQSELIATDEFAGLAAAACAPVTADTWLSGGSTSVGRTTLLLLANPTDVAATVSLQVFGEVGRVTAPGMDGIMVAPGSQRVLSIAGFAPNVQSPVVHVTSTGGEIVASLEQTTVRGLVPGGVDFIGGQPRPLTTTVIPGVVVSASSILQTQIGQSGYDDLQSTLRVFAPGAKGTTVSVTVLSEDGSVTGKPITERIPSGRVTDLPLNSLSDGNYTIVVTARAPVIASVRVSTASSTSTPDAAATTGATPTTDATSTDTTPTAASTDFAWITAAPLLTSGVLFSVASRLTPFLHLENPTSTAQSVSVAAIGGASHTVNLPAHSATSVKVQAGTSYQLSGFTRLYASVSGTTDGGITSYVVSPPSLQDGSIRIYG